MTRETMTGDARSTDHCNRQVMDESLRWQDNRLWDINKSMFLGDGIR